MVRVMLLTIMVAIGHGSSVHVRHFDLIELNHCYSAEGAKCFDQVILWDWSPDYRRWHAQHWVMPYDCNYPEKHGAGTHSFRWVDSTSCIEYRAKLYRETWTLGDPERQNLKLFPAELRRR
jgi:hypothetical protein